MKNSSKLLSIRFTKVTLICMTVMLVSCSFIGKKRDTADDTAGPDITQPPVLIGQNRNVQTETNPDDTVSYDDWRKQRVKELEEEQKKKEAPE